MTLRKFIPMIITLPAIAIGVFAMYRHQVPIAIWSQNIACLVIMSLVSSVLITNNFSIRRSKIHKFIVPFAICLLLLTFTGQGMEGVHRWVSLGIVKLNIAMIVVPILLIELWNVMKTGGHNYAIVIALLIALVLFFQPDASQLTGFAVPMMIMLSRKSHSNLMRLSIIGVFLLLIVLSWVHLDSLPPVDYVEKIVAMVADVGPLWLILGVISLVALPMPFLLFPPRNAVSISRYIGCYYIIIIVSTLFGNFPVPLMGYGISPIIGFYLSLNWYLGSKYAHRTV